MHEPREFVEVFGDGGGTDFTCAEPTDPVDRHHQLVRPSLQLPAGFAGSLFE